MVHPRLPCADEPCTRKVVFTVNALQEEVEEEEDMHNFCPTMDSNNVIPHEGTIVPNNAGWTAMDNQHVSQTL